MNAPPSGCREFRSALEGALIGGSGDGGTDELAWHEHLLCCAGCQELLSSEQALDEILSSLPAPSLPPDLTARVLLRLQRERVASGDELDQLLDSSPSPAAPADLGARVLSRLRPDRVDQRMDALLEQATVTPPPGLAARVLAGLEPHRQRTGRFTLLRGGRRWAAAAALVLALGAPLYWQRTRSRSDEQAPVQEDLLAHLDVLENWEALMSDDLDLYLASLDPVDWTLLELEAEEAQEEEDEG